jgi:hypothetical protein
VILEDVARFQARTPGEQVPVVLGLVKAGLGRSIRSRARGARPVEGAGVLRTPWILIVAPAEPERTAWLEAAIDERVVRRE